MSEGGQEYCNICENFPCLGNHPAGTAGRRREYTFSSVFNVVPDRPLGEWQFGPFRFDGMQAAARGELRRLTEVQDRDEWIEGIRRRLGLVAEVHRCRVWYDGDDWWRWWCLRPACPCGGFARRGPGAFAQALTEALEHARRFVPRPPGPEPFPELSWEAYKALAVLAVVTEGMKFG